MPSREELSPRGDGAAADRSWRWALFVAAAVPLTSGLLLSGVANRLPFVFWGLGVAALAVGSLRWTWRAGRARVAFGLGLCAAFGALSLAALERVYAQPLDVGLRAVAPGLQGLGIVSWPALLLVAAAAAATAAACRVHETRHAAASS